MTEEDDRERELNAAGELSPRQIKQLFDDPELEQLAWSERWKRGAAKYGLPPPV